MSDVKNVSMRASDLCWTGQRRQCFANKECRYFEVLERGGRRRRASKDEQNRE
jgi:hypothetical protein